MYSNASHFRVVNPFPNDKFFTLPNGKKLQTTIIYLMEIIENSLNSRNCGKRRNCSSRAISPFLTVFSKDLYSRHVNTWLVWERVKSHDCLIKGLKTCITAQMSLFRNKGMVTSSIKTVLCVKESKFIFEKNGPMSACADCAGWHESILFAVFIFFSLSNDNFTSLFGRYFNHFSAKLYMLAFNLLFWYWCRMNWG